MICRDAFSDRVNLPSVWASSPVDGGPHQRVVGVVFVGASNIHPIPRPFGFNGGDRAEQVPQAFKSGFPFPSRPG